MKVWAKEEAKNARGNNTGQRENWPVLQTVVPACLNCELRCVGSIKMEFKAGDLEPQAGEGRRL